MQAKVETGTISFNFDESPTAAALRDLFLRKSKTQIKPNNLKYPHKKRKLRVQKKWFNKYIAPKCEPLVIPQDDGTAMFIPYAWVKGKTLTQDWVIHKEVVALEKPNKHNFKKSYDAKYRML